MKGKSQKVIILIIAVVIIIGLMGSFGKNFLSGGTPTVQLADLSQSDAAGDGTSADAEDSPESVSVDVTCETVQAVIETISRPESYSRELKVELFWQEDGETNSVSNTVRTWVDGGYTKTVVQLSGGIVRNSLITPDAVYSWYGTDRRDYQAAAEPGADDLAQNIPTYEDVLQLDPDDITQAGYVRKDGKDCIFVEEQVDSLGYLERYWIETASGLLTAAETEKDGVLTYRMTEQSIATPVPDGTAFALPDGTVLHTADLSSQAE